MKDTLEVSHESGNSEDTYERVENSLVSHI
jgi:hypothetical protein